MASGPWQTATGDFDNDGITDLAVPLPGSFLVSVLLGNGSGGVGDGTFAAPVNYPAPGPRGVTTGDFDNDGITDLAVSLTAPPAVSVLLGNGDDVYQSLTNTFKVLHCGIKIISQINFNWFIGARGFYHPGS